MEPAARDQKEKKLTRKKKHSFTQFVLNNLDNLQGPQKKFMLEFFDGWLPALVVEEEEEQEEEKKCQQAKSQTSQNDPELRKD